MVLFMIESPIIVEEIKAEKFIQTAHCSFSLQSHSVMPYGP